SDYKGFKIRIKTGPVGTYNYVDDFWIQKFLIYKKGTDFAYLKKSKIYPNRMIISNEFDLSRSIFRTTDGGSTFSWRGGSSQFAGNQKTGVVEAIQDDNYYYSG